MFNEDELKKLLYNSGASLVGFADLTDITNNELNRGVSIAVALPKEIVAGIHDGPTREYFDAYHAFNNKLDRLALLAECYLMNEGYYAYAQTTDRVVGFGVFRTRIPHKTVATKSGLGWIGKSALFVSEKFGPAVRLTSVLTNAPLKAGEPVTKSMCGNCMKCTDACPGKAISGKLWNVDLDRDEFFDALACRKKARELAAENIHEEITLCGKCIEVCPYTYRGMEERKMDRKTPAGA